MLKLGLQFADMLDGPKWRWKVWSFSLLAVKRSTPDFGEKRRLNMARVNYTKKNEL